MPMKRPLCNATFLTVLLVLLVCNWSVSSPLKKAAVKQSTLETPEFRPPEYPAYENDLIFGIFNPNGDGSTEIYRSLSQTEGFVLISSVSAGEATFLDRDLKSNTTY